MSNSASTSSSRKLVATTRIGRQLWIRRSPRALAAYGIALIALSVAGCTDAGCVRNSECGAGFECQETVCVIKADDGQDGTAGGTGAITDAGRGAAGGTTGGRGGTSGGRGGSGGTSGGRGSLGSPPAAGAGAGGAT
jgi:hypothetical protein